MKTLLAPLCLAAITASFAPPAAAQAVLTERNISLQLARVIADGAMDACKADKYDISVVILDRTGTVRLGWGHHASLVRQIGANGTDARDYQQEIWAAGLADRNGFLARAATRPNS